MFAPHPLSIFALRATVIADVTAAVGFGVGVYDLARKSGRRHAELVIVTHDRRRADNEHNHFARARLSYERDHAVVGVVKIDPLEAVMTVVLLPQCRLAFVNVIKMLDETAQPVVPREFG